jgi:hypothetical protein
VGEIYCVVQPDQGGTVRRRGPLGQRVPWEMQGGIVDARHVPRTWLPLLECVLQKEED